MTNKNINVREWWVELDGDDDEKEELVWVCSQPGFELCDVIKKQKFETEESSVSIKEPKYYLTSARFSDLTTKEVRKEALKLISIIRAVAKIRNQHEFQSIKLGDSGISTETGRGVELVTFGTPGILHLETTQVEISIAAKYLSTTTSII